jgi:hypothetical protein
MHADTRARAHKHTHHTQARTHINSHSLALLPSPFPPPPRSTRAIAKREAKSVVNVGVEKYISVAGEDVTEARRPKPRSIRRRTGGLSTGGGLESRMASPLRDRGLTVLALAAAIARPNTPMHMHRESVNTRLHACMHMHREPVNTRIHVCMHIIRVFFEAMWVLF